MGWSFKSKEKLKFKLVVPSGEYPGESLSFLSS
jgi:hypothetical protein